MATVSQQIISSDGTVMENTLISVSSSISQSQKNLKNWIDNYFEKRFQLNWTQLLMLRIALKVYIKKYGNYVPENSYEYNDYYYDPYYSGGNYDSYYSGGNYDSYYSYPEYYNETEVKSQSDFWKGQCSLYQSGVSETFNNFILSQEDRVSLSNTLNGILYTFWKSHIDPVTSEYRNDFTSSVYNEFKERLDNFIKEASKKNQSYGGYGSYGGY